MAGFDTLPEGIAPVAYDRAQVRAGIVHIGLGGFARAHLARYTHDLMTVTPEALVWGIIGAGLRSSDRPLLTALAGQDGLYTLVERDQASEHMAVIGSVIRLIDASESTASLLDAIDDDSVAIVTLTVTEHGYCLDRATKRLDVDHPLIAHDVLSPGNPKSAIGVIAEAYDRRRRRGAAPFTTLSCDNIQHNGNVLRDAVLAFAHMSDPLLARWIADRGGFPNAMVDRITPVPIDTEVDDFQKRTGLKDAAPVLAEPFRQWVIEDRFVAGRPAWEQVDAQFVEDVTPYECMKLRLLNASHLLVAGLGQLAGYDTIHQSIADPLIRRAMVALMDRETGPTLPVVCGVDLRAYKHILVTRFGNPAIRDTTQRVNTDAALNYLLDPIRDRLATGASCEILALGVAAWIRRMRRRDDIGRPIQVHHPLSDELYERAVSGDRDPRPILEMKSLFGALGKDERLTRIVSKWLALLADEGAIGALRVAAEDGLI